MKTVEMKHLKHYLDTGLKGNFQVKDVFEKAPPEIREKELRSDNMGFFLEFCKGIFHPLSDLTKPIEYNGEKFVPIEKLFELFYPNHKSKKYYHSFVPNFITCSHNGTAIEYKFNSFDIYLNSYFAIEKLIKWNFWIFDQSYFDEGIIIDINTLEK